MQLTRQCWLAAAALLLALPYSLSAQVQPGQGVVTGRVTDAATGGPLVGVTISVEGTQRGAVTQTDGGYLVGAVPSGVQIVRVTRLGYGAQTRQVTVPSGATATADFALQPQAVMLEGVVAIGYGTRRREDIAGSVEAVTSEDFNTGRIVSPEELIQGKIAGVQVIGTGEPGGGMNIRIRGGTSVNASNEPLFVVDGMPLPSGGGLSAGRNPLNFLNPEDIESITVLKDASATAIYGSRGANGVVIVQTKSGPTHGPQFTYNGSLSTSRVVSRPEMLSAEEFRTAIAQHAPGRVSYLGGANTDWRDAILRSARGQEHTVAVMGAGESMNYRLSIGYLGQEGIIRRSMTERYSAALNYDHRLFNDRLSVRSSLRGARTDDDFTPGSGLGAAMIFDPTQPIRIGDEYFEQRAFELSPTNPIAELEYGIDEGTTYRGIANVEAQYRMPFLEALSATTRLAYDVANSERRVFYPTSLFSQQRSANPGYVNRSSPREVTGLFESVLNYGSQVDVGSSIDATAGYSYEASRGDYPFLEAFGLSTDLLGPHGIPTSEEIVTRLNVREGRLASFFGRVNYAALDRYILTLSVRRDGSSRFGPGNQWGTFPAAAVAWRLSQEDFMQGNAIFSDLKLRASWGVNGNQSFADYMWVPDYRLGDAFSRIQFGDEFVTTIRPSAVDPNIKWEETTSWNVGLDYGVLANRVTGSIEYYIKNTDDLIFRVPVAAGTYVSNFVTTNIGSVRNQGLELSLYVRALDRGPGGLSWNASFVASNNRNELLRINPFGGGSEQILVGGIAGGVGSNIQVLRPGSPVNSFFVHRHKRDAEGRPIYADDARLMYEDVDGDGRINIDDRVPYKSPAPDWTFGHTSQVGLGNFDLSTTLRAHIGNYVYNNLASSTGYYSRLTEAAGPVNLHASVLEYGFPTAQFFSDVYVEDASFLRMDNLTLGYRVGRLSAVQEMRVFGGVQNVFTWTGYSGVDPEAGLGGIDNVIYPRSRTFTFGLSAGF